MTDLLTTNEAAALLGVTPVYVRTLIREGRLPAERYGRDWLIARSALLALERRPVGRPRSASQATASPPPADTRLSA